MVQKVGLIAASGSITRPSFNRSISKLRNLNLEPVYSNSIFYRFLYYAGSADERAKQITDLFANSSVEYIFAVRGGHGMIHAMPYLNYDLIGSNYTPIVGFSDYTILLNYLYSRFGQIHYHGPNVGQSFDESDPSIDFMKKVVLDKEPASFNLKPSDIMAKGTSEAPIVGGNLALLVRSMGTPYEFNSDGKILFIEASGKFPAWIYESLFQLLLAGKFDTCKGIIFGTFRKCGSYSQYLDHFIFNHLQKFLIPIIKNQPFGHEKPNLTIPIGGRCIINTSKLNWTVFQD